MADSKPQPLTSEELERLLADLDAGVYDEQLRTASGAEQAPLLKFSEVKPIDVLAWATARGIKLPGR